MRRLLVGGLVGAVLAAGPAAYATWSDAASGTSGAITTHQVLDPASVTCSEGGLLENTLEFTWTHVDARYTYRVSVERLNGSVVDEEDITPAGAVGSDQQVQLSLGLLGGLLGVSSTFRVRVQSRLGTSSWLSAPGATDTGTFTLGVVASC